MSYCIRACLLIGVLAGLNPAAAVAGPTVMISSPGNLSALTVGQKVEIDVTLSGLPANDFIFNLNTKVLFPSSLFQAVPDASNSSGLTAVVAPGSAFYDVANGPAKIANFYANSSLAPGAANGIFAESPNPTSGAIGLNGLYYSFILQAKGVGSGTIAFDPTAGANEYAADDTGFNYAPLPFGPGLGFIISPAAATVPEPSSILLCAIAGLAGAVHAVLIRQRSSRPRNVA